MAAGFCLYSAASLLVLALKGGGTHIFTLDTRVGEFRLTSPYVRVPKRGAHACGLGSHGNSTAHPTVLQPAQVPSIP